MGVRIATTNSPLRTGRRIAEGLGPAAEVVWIVPDGAAAMARRRSLAEGAGRGAFGTTCCTLSNFIDDRWSLLGTGEACVTSLQRTLFAARALTDAAAAGETSLRVTPGTTRLVGRMVEQGWGLEEFVRAVDEPPAILSEREAELLRVAARYRTLVHEAGLCERSEAMSALAADGLDPWPALLVEGVASLNVAWARFFARVGERTCVTFLIEGDAGQSFEEGVELATQLRLAGAVPEFDDDEEPSCEARARARELEELSAALYHPYRETMSRPTGAVRFALPSGRYAEARAVADELAAAGRAEAAVACEAPETFGGELAELLCDRGHAVEAACSPQVAQTDFGRALRQVADLFDDGGGDLTALSDLAASRVVGLCRAGAHDVDARWRGDRRVSAQDAFEELLCRVDEEARAFLVAAREGDYAAAGRAAERRYADAASLDAAARAANLAAARAAQTFAQQAETAGLRASEALDEFLAARVSVVCEWPAGGGEAARAADAEAPRRVRVMSHDAAARLPRASVDVVVVCDLTSQQQPIKEARTPLDALFGKLGCPAADDLLTDRRRSFAATLRAAREVVVLERRLNDEESCELYPAVVFEDVLDCYGLGHERKDRASGLPASLAAFARLGGEEPLSENLGGRAGRTGRRALACGPADRLAEGSQERLLVPRRGSGALSGVAALSPSAIEAYLDCPYRWFATRRLGAGGLDADFGPAAVGTFAHAVLRRFYERWQADCGSAKPQAEQLREARALLEAEFRDEAARQYTLEPHDNPLIPLSESERLRMEEVLTSLKEFLAYDARLLEGFSPRLFERQFGREERVDYAGVAVLGVIDRVDFDERGRAVVIDYKSSLSGDYALVAADAFGFELPRKVQALVYAQVLRRLLDVEVVGALYLNVLGSASQPRVSGAYDDAVLGRETLPGVKEGCGMRDAGFGSFHALLDAVEELVAQRIERLKGGCVAREPRRAKACEYCPVPNCEGRRAR